MLPHELYITIVANLKRPRRKVKKKKNVPDTLDGSVYSKPAEGSDELSTLMDIDTH